MRQHIYTLAGGIAAIALFTGILYAGSAAIRDRESAAAPELVLETPDMSDLQPAPEEGEAGDVPLDLGSAGTNAEGATENPAPGSSAAAIEPQQLGEPDKVSRTPLDEVKPEPPLADQDNATKAAAKPTVLYRPVAIAAGLIQFDKLTLQLEGIEPEQAERTCESNGKTWPCGVVARTAFRNFLKARALSCNLPEGAVGPSATASCSLGAQDVATWLVDNGWATPLPGSPLEKRAEAAQKAKRGFYGDDPRDLQHTPMTFDDPTAGMDALQPDL